MPASASVSPSVSQPLAILGGVHLESLTISPDLMPGHFIARAVILDLQPSQMVAAIMATESAIKVRHPLCYYRTGWRRASDGLYIYFAG